MVEPHELLTEAELRKAILSDQEIEVREAALDELVRRVRPAQHARTLQGYVAIVPDSEEADKVMIGNHDLRRWSENVVGYYRSVRGGQTKIRVSITLVV